MEIKEWQGNVVEVVSPVSVPLEDALAFAERQGYNLDPSVEAGAGVFNPGETGYYSWLIPIR